MISCKMALVHSKTAVVVFTCGALISDQPSTAAMYPARPLLFNLSLGHSDTLLHDTPKYEVLLLYRSTYIILMRCNTK